MNNTKNEATAQYLKATIKIGSSKGPISYSHNQTVFHHDDIPEQKRLRRNEIKNFLKSRILSVDKDTWNKSNQIEKPVYESRKMENFVHDRTFPFQYNFRAESLDPLRLNEAIDKPTKFHVSTQLESTAREILSAKQSDRIQAGHFMRTKEMPINTKLEGYTPWNESTSFSRREKDQTLAEITKNATNWSAQISQTLPRKKSYDTPQQTTVLFQEEVRRQKKAGEFSLTKQVYQPPLSPVDRTKLRNRYAIEKPNLKTKNSHSGVWEVGHDGRSMWSDTGSYSYDSKGDVNRIVNLDAYNLAGPIGLGTGTRRKLQSG
mmetsp:Transcript_24160/g.33132  ORF Transcript_24160/g.33132 Transcript_24160/m.33132 type:complete len:318 (+) Transcript_24160:24-977(+)|eukprot:CAMPEP_0170113018 /NCGR_PEP_ID=MMETSP0020_2-20130122/9579_1 /TAXON_ID=98059 /ORGANISM="Dinobryon sp., Strain UTEXLB2267" /LENGTH=317 /DNA_ID=CAMNT_0010339175 /DNA_START=96 /DNA_END=1049 /DNA_ORIENTATION=-